MDGSGGMLGAGESIGTRTIVPVDTDGSIAINELISSGLGSGSVGNALNLLFPCVMP